MSALWFAPFIGMTGGYNDVRIGNLVYFVLSLLLLNAVVASASSRPVLGCLTATVAFLGVDFLVTETFQLGIVDQAFVFPLLAAILLAMRSYWRSAAIVAGLALASKHFPAIPVVLALAIYAYRRERLHELVVFCGLTFLAVMLPFILWDPEAFVSATVLHHVHEAGRGDNTALFFFLPEPWKMPFRLFGLALIGGVYVAGLVTTKRPDLRMVFLVIAVVCLLINAFYPVTHLNHLESILAFAAISLALGLSASFPLPAAGRGPGG
jgi:predicted membrane-bound dolichyl-phosphate-mannose-protein mannosyltransferase